MVWWFYTTKYKYCVSEKEKEMEIERKRVSERERERGREGGRECVKEIERCFIARQHCTCKDLKTSIHRWIERERERGEMGVMSYDTGITTTMHLRHHTHLWTSLEHQQ